MKLVRLGGFGLGLLVFIACIVLLLNFTAPNPTGRRYSSRSPFMPPDSTNDIATNNRAGADAEVVLAQDLGITNNNASGQRQCFCQDAQSRPKSCDACVISNKSFDTDRIPDFITDNYIAESKNTKILAQSVASQIQDYAAAATDLNRQLWIFVRLNTEVNPVFEQIAKKTGGGVVYYFATADYVDPLDQYARGGLAVSGMLLVEIGLWEIRVRRSRIARSIRIKPVDTPPTPLAGTDNKKTSHALSLIGDTLDALNRAEDAAKDTRNHLD